MAMECNDIFSENSNSSYRSFDIHDTMTFDDEAEQSPTNLFGASSPPQMKEQRLDSPELSSSFDLFSSPPPNAGKMPARSTSHAHLDLFEERSRTDFPGVFCMSSMIKTTSELSVLDKLKRSSNMNTPNTQNGHDEKPGIALFHDPFSGQTNPSKRPRNDKKRSPYDVVQINSFSGGLVNSPSPISPSSGCEEIHSCRRTSLHRDESNNIVENSRLAHDFDIVSVIGTGVFGTVYRARGRIDNVMYAIKRGKRFKGHNAREKMMHEVHALAALSSKEDADKTMTIVRYYSAWIEDDHVCIQMELCDASVDGLLMTAHRFDKREIFSLLRDVLRALELLHSNDFVHLDIKPANILKKNAHYKLGDFGLALRTNHGRAGGEVEEGDSRYMAKELLGWGAVADLTKCDMFSLGITVLELASGQQVAAEGPEWHSLREGLAPDSTELLTVAPDLSDIIRRLMAASPEARPSAATCLQTVPALMSNLEKELSYFRSRVTELTRQRDNQTAADVKKLKRWNSVGNM